MHRAALAGLLVLAVAAPTGLAQARSSAASDSPAAQSAIAACPPLNGMRRDGADVTVAASLLPVYPAELRPGRYGRVVLEAGAQVVLSSGTYAIDSLTLGPGAIVWFDPFDATGDELIDVVAVRVARKLEIGSAAELALVDPRIGSTRDIEFTVLQGGHLMIPRHAIVRGTLLAPRAKVTFRAGSRLEGAVYAHRVHVDRGVSVQYHPRAEDD